jgi:hypothetical protein
VNNGHIRQVGGPVFGDKTAVTVVGGWFGAEQARRPVTRQDVPPHSFGAPLAQ